MKKMPSTKKRLKFSPAKDIEEIEKELSYEVNSSDLPPEDIVAYNELRSCADLFRLYREGNLEIQPDFQRQVVWSSAMQTRFIDSLTKQLPIPSMCLSLDFKTQKWKVIDGLQRMFTIIKFFSEEDWTLSDVDDIRKEIAGKTVSEIKEKHSILYSKVQNVALPVNILRCDYAKREHAEYIFTIFHRLNAGGIRLNNQEIRNAIYSGPFNDFLRASDEDPIWRNLLGVKDGNTDRFRRAELILRFFAFFEKENEYKGRLSKFLNDYMHEKRFRKDEIAKKEILFRAVIKLIYEKIADKEPLQKKLLKGKVSNVIIEALMVGVARNLDVLANKGKSQLKSRFSKMLSNPAFSEKNISEAILKREKVIARLKAATSSFKKS